MSSPKNGLRVRGCVCIGFYDLKYISPFRKRVPVKGDLGKILDDNEVKGGILYDHPPVALPLLVLASLARQCIVPKDNRDVALRCVSSLRHFRWRTGTGDRKQTVTLVTLSTLFISILLSLS